MAIELHIEVTLAWYEREIKLLYNSSFFPFIDLVAFIILYSKKRKLETNKIANA